MPCYQGLITTDKIDNRSMKMAKKTAPKLTETLAKEIKEVKPEPKKEAEIDGTTRERCKKCLVQIAVRLDTYTWRCPVCGDYEVR